MALSINSQIIESELLTKCWSARDFDSDAKKQSGDALEMLAIAVNEKIRLYPNLKDIIFKAEKTVSIALQNYFLKTWHFQIALDQNILTQNFIDIAMSKPSESLRQNVKKLKSKRTNWFSV